MSRLLIYLLSLLMVSQTPVDSRYYRDKYIADNTKELSMMFIGDIMAHTDQFKSAKKANGSYDFKPWFEHVKTEFESVDLMMGNLETTLTERSDVSGYPMFRTPTSLADALKDAGFDILGTANNHSLDNRLYGVETTLNALRARNLLTTGTYMANEVPRPLIVEKAGIRLGIIASTYGTNGMPLPKDAPHVVNLNDLELYRQHIAWLNEQAVDGVIAFVHWGYEYKRQPHNDQISFAQALADLGVLAVIGSHPHAIQPDAWLEGSNGPCYVVYSLGNAISNQQWRYSDTGLAVKLQFIKHPIDGLSIKHINYLPFWVDKYNENSAMAFAIIPLINSPDLARLSTNDRAKMKEALADFYELYPKP